MCVTHLSFRELRLNLQITAEHCSASGLYNSHLSFHRFPKNTNLRAWWLHKIRRAGFSVTPHTKVCSRHFQDNEINTTAKGRRVLAAGSVSSLFEWKSQAGVWECRSRPPSPEPDSAGPVEDIEHPIMVPMVVDHDYGGPAVPYVWTGSSMKMR